MFAAEPIRFHQPRFRFTFRADAFGKSYKTGRMPGKSCERVVHRFMSPDNWIAGKYALCVIRNSWTAGDLIQYSLRAFLSKAQRRIRFVRFPNGQPA